MNMREEGRRRGRAAAERVKGELHKVMPREIEWNTMLFPTLGKDFDFTKAVYEYDKKRLACTPDYTKLPELRGLADRNLGEREGFIDGTGFTPEQAAFHYTFHFFIWKHVNSHHVARYDLVQEQPPTNCTNVFMPHTAEGGVVISDNRDDLLRPWYRQAIPAFRLGKGDRKHSKVNWVQGGVSSAVLLDEEPECIFPASAHELLPEEAKKDIKEIVRFMDRYKEFWGPGNQLWVDEELRGVMVEKANVRAAYRWPTEKGAICITACSYIDPALNAFKRSRLLEVAKRKGDKPEECTDLVYSDGCDKRQHRLLALMNAEAKRGATLWGALECVADHAVPFPDRVCLAGEKALPEKEPMANWSLTQHAAVITGPNRRGLYRSIQDFDNPKPVYQYTPKLVLGDGVAMKPEWQADIDSGKCDLAPEEKPEPVAV